jgi:TonB-linked SusC/RagA family outer membrane protein
MKKLVLTNLFVLLFLLPCLSVLSQERQVTGNVNDPSGEALPGVSVTIEGTTSGTVTDGEGYFTLDAVSSESILVFSFVGMESQEIAVGNQSSISVVLKPDAIGIDEVLVIGYGTRTKATVTGSVATMNGDEILKSRTSNVTTGLAGQIPGLIINQREGRPGAENVEILVRGKATLGNSNNPLLIIDGIPTGIGRLARLNPNDIESISVLKDASAAIYGVNAANGVILVTTKRGRSGEAVYSLTGTFSWTQPTKTPNWTNSYETAIAINEEAVNAGLIAVYSDEDVEKFRTGSSPLTHAGPDVNWYDETFKKWAPMQRYDLSVNGGSEKVNYFISAEFLNQKGQYVNSDAVYYKQYQVRSNLDFQATKNLKLSVDISASVSDRSQEQSTTSTRLRSKQAAPETIFTYPNGLLGNMQYGLNPTILGSKKAGYNEVANNGVTGVFRYDYKMDYITKGLSFSGYMKYGVTSGKTSNWINTWNTYSYDEATGEYVAVPSGWTTLNPRLAKTYRDNTSSLITTQLNYNRAFGDHSLDILVGMEAKQGWEESLYGRRGDYLTNIIEQISAGDELTDDNGGSDTEFADLHYYGRFNYGYKAKYLIDISVRADGSYKFPDGKKWGIFPAVSAAWRISEESFFKDNIGFISYMKFRGSWGRSGFENTPGFQYLATYSTEQSNWRKTYLGEGGLVVPGLRSNGYPNPDITWEEQESFNVGVDMNFLNGEIDLTADYFKNKRSSILIARNESVPQYYGIVLPDENIGIVDSWGFDGNLSFRKIVSKDFSYHFGGTFTFARNRAVFLDEAAGVLEYQKKEGHSVDVLDNSANAGTSHLLRLILVDDGLFQNQGEIDAYPHLPGTQPGDIKYIDQLSVDTNGDGIYDEADGEINDQDRVRFDKSRSPEIVYGVNLGANYKGFDILVRLQGQARAWNMVQPEMLRTDKAWFEGRWQKEGDNEYPRSYLKIGNNQIGSTNNDRRSTFWLKDASFMRVKTVELGYNLPKSLLGKAKIKQLRIFINAENLFVIDKMEISRDPELDSWRSYELSRVLTAGINLNF